MELPTQAAMKMRARRVIMISLIAVFPLIAVLTGGVKVTVGAAELDCARPAVWVAPDGRTIEAGLPAACTNPISVVLDGWKIGATFTDQTPAGEATTIVEPGKQTKLAEPAIGCGPHQLDVRLASESRPARHDGYGPGLLSAFEVFPAGYRPDVDLGQLTILAGEACQPPTTTTAPPPPVAVPPTTTAPPAITCPAGICATVALPPTTTTSTTPSTTTVARRLPETGASTGLLGLAGLGVLTAGWALLLATRKGQGEN